MRTHSSPDAVQLLLDDAAILEIICDVSKGYEDRTNARTMATMVYEESISTLSSRRV